MDNLMDTCILHTDVDDNGIIPTKEGDAKCGLWKIHLI